MIGYKMMVVTILYTWDFFQEGLKKKTPVTSLLTVPRLRVWTGFENDNFQVNPDAGGQDIDVNELQDFINEKYYLNTRSMSFRSVISGSDTDTSTCILAWEQIYMYTGIMVYMYYIFT